MMSKKNNNLRREERLIDQKAFRTKVYIILTIVGFLLFMALIGFIQQVDFKNEPNAATEDSKEMSLAEILSKQKSLKSKIDINEAKINSWLESSDNTEELAALMKQSLQWQSELVATRMSSIADRTESENLNRFKIRYDTYMSKPLHIESKKYEEEARSLWNEGASEEAIKRMKLAITQQVKINQRFGNSKYSDLTRTGTLQNELNNWETKPTADKADSLLNASKAKLEKQDFKDAIQLAEEAYKIQKELTSKHRNTNYGTYSRLKQFENHLDYSKNAEYESKINSFLLSASKLMEKNIEEAQNQLSEAEFLLSRIEASYPNKLKLTKNFQTIKATVNSYTLAKEVQKFDSQLKKALKDKAYETAGEALPIAFRKAEQLNKQFELSTFNSVERLERLSKLVEIRNNLEPISTRVWDNLIFFDSKENKSMLNSELHQNLLALMGFKNPSLHKGSSLPVDSISALEAEEILKTLSWILQSQVTLPSKADYLEALKNENLKTLSKSSWNSRNTDSLSQRIRSSKPTKMGFYDLLGNVSEWVTDGDDYLEIGGSIRDNYLNLEKVPDRKRSKREKSRNLGFRFVVYE